MRALIAITLRLLLIITTFISLQATAEPSPNDAPGVEVFVYGRPGGRFPARQHREGRSRHRVSRHHAEKDSHPHAHEQDHQDHAEKSPSFQPS